MIKLTSMYVSKPVVITDKKDKYTERSVAGPPYRVLGETSRGPAQGGEKEGRTYLHVVGRRDFMLAGFRTSFVVEDTDIVRASIRFNFEAWVRGIFKIVLGLGHIVLGPNWTFSAEGDRVRSVLFLLPKDWPRSSMQGFTTGCLPPGIANALGIDAAIRAQN